VPWNFQKQVCGFQKNNIFSIAVGFAAAINNVPQISTQNRYILSSSIVLFKFFHFPDIWLHRGARNARRGHLRHLHITLRTPRIARSAKFSIAQQPIPKATALTHVRALSANRAQFFLLIIFPAAASATFVVALQIASRIQAQVAHARATNASRPGN